MGVVKDPLLSGAGERSIAFWDRGTIHSLWGWGIKDSRRTWLGLEYFND